ncbi:MAG: putative sigma-54 modulation protein [Saprospiraceae bacterium]|jgi:putative sigma-54 modulation protein
MKIHTQAVHFSADQKLVSFIEKKVTKLDQIFDKIITIDVILKLENSGQVKDKVAELKLKIPGTVLFAKESSKTFEESIDNAIDALKKQLVRHKVRND